MVNSTDGQQPANQSDTTSDGAFEVFQPQSDGNFASPVFDLHGQSAQAAPQPAQQIITVPVGEPMYGTELGTDPVNAVKVGEETIEIAPHPTTNRFPWAPVANPTVPVYQMYQQYAQQNAQPPAPAIPPAPPVQEQKTPVTMPTQPAEPIAAPPPPPEPPIVPPTSVPAQLPEPMPIAPKLEPVPPVPPPAPPVAVIPEPPPLPAPLPPEPMSVQKVHEPPRDVSQTASEPQKPIQRPAPHHVRGTKIYSEHTRKAWRVFKPDKLYKASLLLSILAVVGVVITVWFMSGRPTDIFNIPFFQNLIENSQS